MPELPEVETVRRIVAPLVIGTTIRDVKLRDFPAVLEAPVGIDARSALIGARITDVHRRGKYLLVELESGLWVVIHLRMTGRLLIVPTGSAPVRFEHLAMELENGHELRYADQRKFGRVRVTLPEDVAALDAKLGPEPFDKRLTGRRFHEAMRRKTGKIKAVLLDQQFLAGMGNIYVDEALFRTKIHPERTARDLSVDDATRLLGAIRHVLRQAIANQGTTFSSFENPYGQSGSNATYLRVYGKGRTDAPCPRCGTLLGRLVVGGRGTTFCPRCQRLPSQIVDPAIP
jgi:formamidopyrimidine-DNA glycosylase